jgi:hypothetical protein
MQILEAIQQRRRIGEGDHACMHPNGDCSSERIVHLLLPLPSAAMN